MHSMDESDLGLGAPFVVPRLGKALVLLVQSHQVHVVDADDVALHCSTPT